MLKGNTKSGYGNPSIRAKNRNMPIKPTNQKAKVGTVQVIKTNTNTNTKATQATAINSKTATPKQVIQAKMAEKSKLIKKAHVRFDDYLDLNEENMRRSCKRLMNHLYSDSKTNESSQNAVPTISHCRSQSQQQQQQQHTNKCPNSMQTGAPIKSVQNFNLGRTLPQTPIQAKTVNSKGKSYLRSQYERRQLRQLELMQQETTSTNRPIDINAKSDLTDGAIIVDEENHRRQQQDLMAKSHELSKRRFFEKLERRGSLKNSNLNISSIITPMIEQISENTDVKLNKQSEITRTEESNQEEEEEAPEERDAGTVEENQRAGNEQKKPITESKSGYISNNIAKNGDDELMLKVYQSILKGNTELQKDNNDTHDGLDGANAKELTSEPVAFYPPLLESANTCEHEQEKLIELSTNAQGLSLLVTENSTPQEASSADESAFEIRVDAAECDFSADSLDQSDKFISSSLLVVKQVEAVDIDGYQRRQEFLDKSADELLSYSNGRMEATTETCSQMASSNKTKMPPLVYNSMESNKNIKVVFNSAGRRQICDGSGDEKRTCTQSELIVLPQKSMPIKSLIMDSELSSQPTLSKAPIDGDNQQHAAGVSSTISRKSNSNEMKTTPSLEVTVKEEEIAREREEEVNSRTTGIVERVGKLPRKSDNSNYFNITSNEQQSEVESDCAKDHELPETVMFFGQSGGASENRVNTEEPNVQGETYVARLESAAQAQQVVNLQAEITKITIRDVLPEASGNETEKFVSCVGTEEAGKVRDVSGFYTQFNGEQHQVQCAPGEQNFIREERGDVRVQERVQAAEVKVLETSGYANPKPKENGIQNNATIDVNDGGIYLFECKNNGKMMSENNQLIKSFTNVHSKLVHQQSSSVQSTAEEDNGSSCSSSGFGASASSSDGSASIKGTDNVAAGIKRDISDCRRPNIAIKSRDEHRESTCNPLYDSVRFPRNSVRIQHPLDESKFPDYKLLVGPDQGYPSKSSNRTLVIENHNYASIVNRCESDQSKPSLDQSISLERDDFVGYANLPRKKIPPVEYATVRPISDGSKNKLKNSSSEISLSAQSYSTTSANSGGFSALPPAQVEHHSTANNFDSLVSLSPDNSHRKSSIFKRFGSLVSKAFTVTSIGAGLTTTNTNTKVFQSANSEINERTTQKIDCQEENNASKNIDVIGESKLALVIDQDHQKATGQKKVEDADLVILPAKHVNQRKHHQEQNLTIRRHDDDRLSRGKKHSRKMKQTDSSTSLDSTSTSSSYSLSSPTEFRHRRHNGHVRKADSLSEDLESLMSRSEHSNENGNEKREPLKSTSAKIGTLPKIKDKTTNSSLERFEIDCIRPNRSTADTKEMRGRKSEASSQLRQNKRSVLRLLNKTPTARCAVESTPNLIKSQSREFQSLTHSSTRQGNREETEEEDYDGEVQQPISGFWGFSSLMSRSHAKISENTTNSKSEWKSKSRVKKNVEDLAHQDTSIYGNFQPIAAGYKLHLPKASSEERQIDKCQSLNLYQNLLRNYGRRRHRHHGHHHHHSHYHHHGRAHYSTSRHAHHSVRCIQNCGRNCLSSDNSESFNGKGVVFGQLIKISKSDGSQVIELERSPGRPWGFFVARGAINNTKGKK